MGKVVRMLYRILFLLLAFLHFQVHCSLTSSSSFFHSAYLCLPEQRAALLEFKNTISLDDCWVPSSYPTTNSWNESTDCCSWDGVSCHMVTGHVIGIDLSASCLNGTLPANNSLFHLQRLQWLDLSANNLHGSLLEISSLFHLQGLQRLNLAHNYFNGSISSELFNQLVSLTHLNLSCNSFSDLIPYEISLLSKLVSLDLSRNGYPSLRFDSQGSLPNHVSELQLLGDISISNNLISGGVPSWLFTLPSLGRLDLSHNKLTGPIDQIQKPNSLEYIDLSSNGIHGSISNSFFDLVSLETLDLSSNKLSGVIKSNMLAKLKNLTDLHLSNNSLLSLSTSGNDVNYSFPQLVKVSFSSCSIRQFPSFFRTSNLNILDLSNNKIYGGISKWEAEGWESLLELYLSNNSLTNLEQFPGMNLEVLDLRSNLLQGPILSNSLICNQSSLVFLDLSRNYLTGTIPNCLGNFSFFLQFMNLEMNNFYGKVPDSFTSNSLTNLFLNDNQLKGLLPRSLANCSSLKILNLRNNKFDDTFPHWLASLPDLQVLILRKNRLYGPMPNSIASSNFSALQIIDLSHNVLTGPLPTKFFQNLRAMKDHVPRKRLSCTPGQPYNRDCASSMVDIEKASVNVTTKKLEMELVETLTIFTSIDFSNNLFCGHIPEELGELISLQTLNLSNNNLTGPIPPSFGNMVALESLDLSSNKLGGRIPSQLTNLTFLEVLNLSQNDLVGPIPHGKQFDTFENDSYSGNLGLCGFPLSKQCGNDEEPKPPVAMLNEDEGSEIAFIWKVVMMGYGCGVVLGLSMGYIVFTTGRPWCTTLLCAVDAHSLAIANRSLILTLGWSDPDELRVNMRPDISPIEAEHITAIEWLVFYEIKMVYPGRIVKLRVRGTKKDLTQDISSEEVCVVIPGVIARFDGSDIQSMLQRWFQETHSLFWDQKPKKDSEDIGNSYGRLPYQLWNVNKYGTCVDAAITGIMPLLLMELQVISNVALSSLAHANS
ncbi:Receptor like protein 33 [Theobroma cacao]|uniref:Receptor like protein 33 n=1 Tax=Theobroma cacao TaxID=3641 RepID=S1SMN8_THECC|nr:Receptor like protein 33 [Theobroma cacao]